MQQLRGACLMLMPGRDRQPLPEQLEALRQQIASLPTRERRALLGAVWADNLRRNDARHQECYERAERERNRKRPDSRQMRLEGAA